MSKQWMVVIGVIVGVLALCLAGAGGAAIGRASGFAAMNRAGFAPSPRGFHQPGQFEGRGPVNQNPAATNPQLEVELLDDNGDGIPDRGVVEMPAGPNFNRDFDGRFGPAQAFGRGFHPEPDRFNRPPLLPFAFFGGLFCLTLLAGLAALGVVLYRRQPSGSPAPIPVPAPPMDVGEPEIPEPDSGEPESGEPETDAAGDTPAGEDADATSDEASPE